MARTTETPGQGRIVMIEPTALAMTPPELRAEQRDRPRVLQSKRVAAGGLALAAGAPSASLGMVEGGSPLMISMGRVALVMIDGCMWYDEDMCWWYGGVSHSEITDALRAARNDPASDTVVLVINSGGGSVAGMTELMSEARALAAEKTVVALARECMCSAAYWLATSASRIVATRTAIVGSIGTRMMGDLWDDTKALDEAGYARVKMQYPGRMKDPSPGPIDDGIVKAWMDNLASTFAPFRTDVATARTLTPQQVDAMEAHWFTAELAMGKGLVDEIVDDAGAWLAGIGVSGLPGIVAEGDDESEDGQEAGYDPAKKESEMSKQDGVPADALKGVDLTGFKAQRPDLVAALRGEFEAQLQEAPATTAALNEICGEDSELFKQAVVGQWSVDKTRTEAMKKTSAQLATANTRIAELTAVRAKGGGGGTDPVGGGNEGTATGSCDFINLVNGAMAANPKLGFDRACHEAACNPKNAKAHGEWIAKGCPDK